MRFNSDDGPGFNDENNSIVLGENYLAQKKLPVNYQIQNVINNTLIKYRIAI